MKNHENKDLNFAFFGTGEVSVTILDNLKNEGYLPKVVVTMPDKPKGRNLVLTPPEVKIWSEKNNVECLQPEKLDNEFFLRLSTFNLELSVVVSYGKIIPKNILDIPKLGSLNIHYSLLPKLRGSSPVEGAILMDDRDTGVSIIKMDEKMDHGPIIAQKNLELLVWPIGRNELMEKLNALGGKLLLETLPQYISGNTELKPQDEERATYVKMIKKEDAMISLTDDPYLNYKKILAYEKWPRAYFIENSKRVIVNKVLWKDGKLEILRVTPEGKKEVDYKLYIRDKR